MRINGEIDAMRTLTGHPNICALHAVLHTPDNVHIVMDRGQIDLYEYFEGPLPEDEVLGITKVARAPPRASPRAPPPRAPPHPLALLSATRARA